MMEEDNIIGTTSYSEAMDLSDLDDCGYEQESSPERTPAPAPTQPEPVVKVRKKPGRKPNPASPALRKAQNRAAQRAFRERKERHMKELESNIKGIKDHRDKLQKENETMSSENEILKAENWYLKGIVLSLQLVCLQHNLVIPQHCPHVDEQTLGVLNQSIPASIASYINVNSRNKLQISSKLMTDQPEMTKAHSMTPQKQVRSGSLIITQDGVHSVPKQPNTSWYHQHTPTAEPQQLPEEQVETSQPSSNDFQNIPPLSPMSTDRENSMTSDLPEPVLLSTEPVTSNLAAIQTLRLRLRLQSACMRMESVPFAIQPTSLQLAIPHDPRIDLIPTPHMRDRMILYRDQFDLDDCFRCLLGGSVFHGGDPGVAGNWQLPAEFFEKYWFLTIDYNLRRCTNEWRKLQGLKEIKNIPNETPPPPSLGFPKESLNYQDLSGYLGLNQQQQAPQQEQKDNPSGIMPVQLTNGYGIMNNHAAAQTPQQLEDQRKSANGNNNLAWESLFDGLLRG